MAILVVVRSGTGVSRTRVTERNGRIHTVCGACGEGKETAEYLVHYCKGLHPACNCPRRCLEGGCYQAQVIPDW